MAEQSGRAVPALFLLRIQRRDAAATMSKIARHEVAEAAALEGVFLERRRCP